MKRQKQEPSGPSNAYLVSFGDTMTALLAFFIVLNSLATEQTGANLYSGTGSFMAVGDSAGVPGLFPLGQSTYAVQMDQPSPLYIVEGDEEADPTSKASGPDKDGDTPTVRDREQDDLERFLNQMGEQHETTANTSVTGEVVFDRMPALPREGEPMDQLMHEQLLRFAPILRRRGYELEIRIWATTPAPTAWQRAADQAARLRPEVVSFMRLRSDQAKKVTTSASPWHSSDIKRPAASFILRRVE